MERGTCPKVVRRTQLVQLELNCNEIDINRILIKDVNRDVNNHLQIELG